ncbi:hypothetical protein D3C86_2148610 [compost metagenome]
MPMETYPIGPAISLIGSLVTFAFGYGSLSARHGALLDRLKALEKDIEQTVTRAEFKALSNRLDDMVAEIRGLRSDLLAIVREGR